METEIMKKQPKKSQTETARPGQLAAAAPAPAARKVQELAIGALERLQKRSCRICGCTEDNACLVESPEGRRGCAWVSSQVNICTACYEKMNAYDRSIVDTVVRILAPLG